MNIDDVRAFCLSLPGVSEDMPYGPDWIVFRIEGKIFLHIPLNSLEPKIAIKMEPSTAIELREHYCDVTPAWHLNKRHWSDVVINNLVPDSMLCQWIAQSYNIVVNKLPMALRAKYADFHVDNCSSYEEYCRQQEQAFYEEFDENRCFPDMPEGLFVRCH